MKKILSFSIMLILLFSCSIIENTEEVISSNLNSDKILVNSEISSEEKITKKCIIKQKIGLDSISISNQLSMKSMIKHIWFVLNIYKMNGDAYFTFCSLSIFVGRAFSWINLETWSETSDPSWCLSMKQHLFQDKHSQSGQNLKAWFSKYL